MAGGQDGARRKPGFLTFPIWLPHVTGADTYEIRLCPYIAVNVVPDSQRCQKMNPHLTAIQAGIVGGALVRSPKFSSRLAGAALRSHALFGSK